MVPIMPTGCDKKRSKTADTERNLGLSTGILPSRDPTLPPATRTPNRSHPKHPTPPAIRLPSPATSNPPGGRRPNRLESHSTRRPPHPSTATSSSPSKRRPIASVPTGDTPLPASTAPPPAGPFPLRRNTHARQLARHYSRPSPATSSPPDERTTESRA